jgi:hypothetical protein
LRGAAFFAAVFFAAVRVRGAGFAATRLAVFFAAGALAAAVRFTPTVRVTPSEDARGRAALFVAALFLTALFAAVLFIAVPFVAVLFVAALFPAGLFLAAGVFPAPALRPAGASRSVDDALRAAAFAGVSSSAAARLAGALRDGADASADALTSVAGRSSSFMRTGLSPQISSRW